MTIMMGPRIIKTVPLEREASIDSALGADGALVLLFFALSSSIVTA